MRKSGVERTCATCPADISHRGCSAKWCKPCARSHHLKNMRKHSMTRYNREYRSKERERKKELLETQASRLYPVAALPLLPVAKLERKLNQIFNREQILI